MGRDTKGQDKIVRSDEHNSRGIELADRGWLDEAIKEFKKAIELDPMSAHAHDNLATVYSEKKLYAQAMEEYLTALKLEPDRPTALRECIRECRNGGVVSIIGAYGGFVDKFPIGSIMNRSLTIRSGQCHVQRYLKPLLDRVERGEIDPSFIVTHRLKLDEAPKGYDLFLHKRDECVKVVLRA